MKPTTPAPLPHPHGDAPQPEVTDPLVCPTSRQWRASCPCADCRKMRTTALSPLCLRCGVRPALVREGRVYKLCGTCGLANLNAFLSETPDNPVTADDLEGDIPCEGDDEPGETPACPLCGDGGCPSCRPGDFL